MSQWLKITSRTTIRASTSSSKPPKKSMATAPPHTYATWQSVYSRFDEFSKDTGNIYLPLRPHRRRLPKD